MTDNDIHDDELRGIAMAALYEHEAAVSRDETENALAAVRARIDSGDPGGTSPVLALSTIRRERSPWLLLGAAAAVIGLVGAGLVAVLGGADDDTIVPASVPTTVSVPEPTVDTTVSSTTVEEASPTTTAPGESVLPRTPQTIAVDAANPPVLVEPEAFVRVPLEPDPNGNGVDVAIGPDNIVVKQPASDFVSLIGPPENTVQQVPVPAELRSIVSGPGPVIYGLGDPVFAEGDESVPSGIRIMAVPFLGDRIGEVIAEGEVGLNEYLELPEFFFGHGPDGIVDRGRQVGRTLLGYVDETGTAIDVTEAFPLPAFADIDDDGVRDTQSGLVEVLDTDLSWQLDIRRDPAHADSFVGPSFPAPTTGGRVIYFERIGADLTPGQDFGPSAMPVVAVLDPDGSGSWVRLPDDWDVVASDVWGTVLMRRTATELEFALLDDALPPPVDTPTPATSVPAPSTQGALAIARNCVSEFDCTQLATAEDGRIVAFDPTDRTLRVFDSAGSQLRAEVPIAADVPLDRTWFVDVGPDDVAYLSIPTPGLQDPGNDLLAIPLVGSQAGSVVMSWTGLDGSGDSTLVARRTGLTVVYCCGLPVTRPEPDAPIYRWVDRNGEVVESTSPSFDLNLGDAGNSLTRIDGASTFTRFALPTVFQYPRDFPITVPTDDGGALALDYLQESGTEVIVDFNTDWPENGIDNADVYYLDRAVLGFGTILLEPSGTVIIAEGDEFVRRSLDEIGTPGWPGQIEIDRTLEVWAVDAPGLNEYIDGQQPVWATDPTLLGYQIVPKIDANEQVLVEFDEASGGLTITTSGFLDDSVFASRIALPIRVGADGLFRIDGTGSQGQQCQPGRGHQDFSTEPCL